MNFSMNLGELIGHLEKLDPDQPVAHGFGRPHSYRGYYDELAFEPVADTTVGAMLAEAREALGTTYQGYKGGDYTMTEHTGVWLACCGETGEEIGPSLLGFMLFGRPLLAPASLPVSQEEE